MAYESKGDNLWKGISREEKMATDSLCLENLDEFVNDENKIVRDFIILMNSLS